MNIQQNQDHSSLPSTSNLLCIITASSRRHGDNEEEKEQSKSNNDEPERPIVSVYNISGKNEQVPLLSHDPSWKVVQCLCSRYPSTDLQDAAQGILWLQQQQSRL